MLADLHCFLGDISFEMIRIIKMLYIFSYRQNDRQNLELYFGFGGKIQIWNFIFQFLGVNLKYRFPYCVFCNIQNFITPRAPKKGRTQRLFYGYGAFFHLPFSILNFSFFVLHYLKHIVISSFGCVEGEKMMDG